MPKLSRLFVRTGFLYLALGLGTGLLHASARAGLAPAAWQTVWPTYLHLLTIGWITHLIIGVAHWMFPIMRPGAPRGREWLIALAYGLLNVGLLLRASLEPFPVALPAARSYLLAVAGACLWLGGVAFVWNTWPRIR